MTEVRIPKVEVRAGTAPDPHLIRAAVEARLAGRPWAGPEAAVADAIRQAVDRC